MFDYFPVNISLHNNLFDYLYTLTNSSSTVHVLREDGSKAPQHELGRIAIKLPLPPGFMLTLYQASERFKQVYFSTFPVSKRARHYRI